MVKKPTKRYINKREWKLARALEEIGYSVTVQFPLPYTDLKGKLHDKGDCLHFDICIPLFKLIIEVDGESHQQHKQTKADVHRDRTAFEQGYELIRVTNDEVDNMFDELVYQIHQLIRKIDRDKNGGHARYIPLRKDGEIYFKRVK